MGICVGGPSSWRNSFDILTEEPNGGETVWRIFASWFGTYFVYVCIYTYTCLWYIHQIWCKSQKSPMVFQVNTVNLQYFWIFLDIQITEDPLYTAVLTTIFLMTTPTKNMVYFSVLLAAKYDNLIIVQNELQNWQPKVYEIYWQKTNKVSAPPIFLGGGTTLCPKFWKRTEKQWVCACVCVWGGEGGAYWYLFGGCLLCFLSKKTVK